LLRLTTRVYATLRQEPISMSVLTPSGRRGVRSGVRFYFHSSFLLLISSPLSFRPVLLGSHLLLPLGISPGSLSPYRLRANGGCDGEFPIPTFARV